MSSHVCGPWHGRLEATRLDQAATRPLPCPVSSPCLVSLSLVSDACTLIPHGVYSHVLVFFSPVKQVCSSSLNRLWKSAEVVGARGKAAYPVGILLLDVPMGACVFVRRDSDNPCSSHACRPSCAQASSRPASRTRGTRAARMVSWSGFARTGSINSWRCGKR